MNARPFPPLIKSFIVCLVSGLVSLFAVSIQAATISAEMVGDDAFFEGNAGPSPFFFTARFVVTGGPTSVDAIITWSTADGTATGADYIPGGGLITLPAGSTDGPYDFPFTVDVNGDLDFEPDEAFTVQISDLQVTGPDITGGVTDASSTGTIWNDDAASEIHGFKFEDVDGNGVFGGPDVPLSGVSIDLTGTVTSNVVTDASGEYHFEGLPAGSYTVTETVPPGFVATTPPTIPVPLGVGEVLVAMPGQGGPLDPGQVEIPVGPGLMFGNTVPGSIHGFKFEDVDANGIYIPGLDQPLEGVTFTLQGVDGMGNPVGPVDVQSGPDGKFAYTNLMPGDYDVTESVPAGHVPTTPPMPYFLGLQSRQELVAFDGDAAIPPGDPRVEINVGPVLMFGNTVPGSIHGFKFEDVDGDGIYTPGLDLPLAGVEFVLVGSDGMGNPVGPIPVPTDPDGKFWFTGLLPGVYDVFETIPAGHVPTTPPAFNTLLESRQELVAFDGDAMLPPGDPRVEVNVGAVLMFGNTVPGSIHGFKFEDVDGDGVFTPGLDQPLPGVSFELTGVDGMGNPVGPISLVTDGAGKFGFTSLLPGNYTVTEIALSGFDPTTPPSFTSGVLSRQELVAIDGDAMLAPGDPRLEVNVGTALMFGNAAPGSIHGLKYDDLNGNGQFDPGFDLPLPGVEFILNGTDGLGNPVGPSPVLTDVNGEFAFTGLMPGDYTVTETVPPGQLPSTPTSFNSLVFSREELVAIPGQAQLPPGDPRVELLVGPPLMFGNLVLGSIHGFKYEDVDANGIYTAGLDQPLEGVEFNLFGVDGMGNPVGPVPALTDVDGKFAFAGLQPGNYDVVELVPPGHIPTTPPVYSTPLQSRQELVAFDGDALLPPGDPRVEQNVGSALMFGNTVPGSIHGFKYEDIDSNGAYDPAVDVPLAGVEFRLSGTDGQGNLVVQSTTTDGDGEFDFINLLPSVPGIGPGTGYTVAETVPPGHVATTPTTFITALQSREELVAVSGQAELPPGALQVEVLVGSGLVFGNTVPGSIHGIKFEDVDGDGIYNPGIDQPLPGVPFTLAGTDGLGNVINQLTFTDVNGEFWFIGLLASVNGTGPATGYTVSETVPPGFVATTPTILSTNLLSRQELVAEVGQAMLPPGDPRVEVVIGADLLFGNTVPGSIHGFKFEDLNANGVYEPGIDQPSPGVGFTLTGTDGQGNVLNLLANTDANGEFAFTGLLPSVIGAGPATGYTVTELVPPGYLPTTPTSFSSDLFSRWELVANPGQAIIPPGDPRIELLVGPPLFFGNTLTLDYGDAPDPAYPTLLASDGARHVIPPGGATLYLGVVGPDPEFDGQPNALANGDDNSADDDEDGVIFPDPVNNFVFIGRTIEVDVIASTAGLLDGWVDSDRNGAFDPDEHINLGAPLVVTAGVNKVSITIPQAAAEVGASYARFRLSSAGIPIPFGLALDGEVEDYPVNLKLNAPPVADDDTYATDRSCELVVDAASGVLVGDTDGGDGPIPDLVIIGVQEPPSGGNLVLNPDGSFTYTPVPGFVGPETFTYIVSDGLDEDIGEVTITINNFAPVPGSQSLSTDEEVPLPITLTATDPDCDDEEGLVTIQIDTPPSNGTLLGTPPNVTYVPDPNFTGMDSFTIMADDGVLPCVAMGVIDIEVIPVPQLLPCPISPANNAVLDGITWPDFEWQTLGPNAEYRVWIGNVEGTTPFYAAWLPPGTTFLSAAEVEALDLPPGEYRWWVRGWDPSTREYTDWCTLDGIFSVLAQVPGPTTLIDPTDDEEVTNPTPTFEWTATHPEATWYRLWVNLNGNRVILEWVQGATTFTPADPVGSGNFEWWVRPWNSDGFGPWSESETFTIPSLPGIVPLVSETPDGGGNTDYTFDAVGAATQYQIWVNCDNVEFYQEWVETGLIFPGTETFTVGGHTPGSTYKWWIRAWGPGVGHGPWSAPRSYTYPVVP